MKTHTPKHFVIQLGALLALYTSLTALVTLLFSIINLAFPDAADYGWQIESAQTAIRTSFAILVVFFPTYLTLTRLANVERRKNDTMAYLPLTRWLVYLSLLAAGGVMLGDLVVLINYFLNGEITTRFLLKVLALMVVVGAAFHYYILDLKGYFKTHVTQSLYFAVGATVVVIASLLFGLTYTDAPSVVRELKIDDQQVMDLQEMQSYIESYYYNNEQLPETLTIAYDGLTPPVAPESRPAYSYIPHEGGTYELCATFSAATSESDRSYAAIAPDKNYNWQHDAGEWCFSRSASIDPTLR